MEKALSEYTEVYITFVFCIRREREERREMALFYCACVCSSTSAADLKKRAFLLQVTRVGSAWDGGVTFEVDEAGVKTRAGDLYVFYSPSVGSIQAHKVKPFTFDLLLFVVIAIYLAALYTYLKVSIYILYIYYIKKIYIYIYIYIVSRLFSNRSGPFSFQPLLELQLHSRCIYIYIYIYAEEEREMISYT